MGEGTSVQTGGIREEGRTAQVQGYARVLRGRGQTGGGGRVVWFKWVVTTQLKRNISTTKHLSLSQSTVYSAFLPL